MTKVYKNLWEKFIDAQNLQSASLSAVYGKKNRDVVADFTSHKTQRLSDLRKMLTDGTYRTSPYIVRTIYRPKQRTIYVLPLYPDRIVQHALINILGPIWKKSFINDSYACISGRGLHAASRRTMEYIRHNKYVLHCDIRKFYPNINHGILLDIISRKIHDEKIMALIRDIVCSIDGETNVPIGNLTSQWFGNVYLNELDRFVRQELRVHDYIRYCDDFILFSDDKKQLHEYAEKIRNFLYEKLELTFSKCVVYPVSHGVDFIGYRHFKKFILLRQRTAHRIKKRVKKIFANNDTSNYARGVIASAYGWARWANTYNFRKKLVAGIPRTNKFRKILRVE